MSQAFTFFMVGIVPLMALGLAYLGWATVPTNPTGWCILFIGLSFVIGGPVYVLKRRKDPPARKEERGDRSFWLVQPGFILAIFGAPLEYLFLPALLPRPAWFPALGLVMVILGIILLVWARRAIQGQFTGHLQIQPEHRLVQDGPYRFVRHPAYLGYLLLALGIGIGYSSLIAIGAVIVLLLPGLVYRLRVEEELLVEAFGEDYRRYARRTRRLFPGLW